MKRFILFCGAIYYAQGGGHDFRGSFDTICDAAIAGEQQTTGDQAEFEWWHVFDAHECEVVAASEDQAVGVE